MGNSGKSAVVDLLREVDGVFVPEYWFEFDILRVPGGLLDLRHHLVGDWSPVRSHAAVREFLRVTRKMGRDPAWWDLLGLLDSSGQRYERRFRGSFLSLSRQLANGFIRGRYRAEWPFDALGDSYAATVVRKVLRRLGLRRQIARDVLLVGGSGFDQRAAGYLESLYNTIVPPGTDRAVLNNGFEPFNPLPALEMLPSARQVVVTRDPRDVYVSGLNAHRVTKRDKHLIACDNDGLNKSFLATDDLEMFVARHRLYAEKLFRGSHWRVLHVRFEDIVLNYDAVVSRILAFLGIDPSRHVRPRTTFQPERSRTNVGLWKRYTGREEIEFIESKLADFLSG